MRDYTYGCRLFGSYHLGLTSRK
ncbi:hypothetical protein EMIT0111MI5_40132 [Burkholderia sp. IT-111MI5]